MNFPRNKVGDILSKHPKFVSKSIDSISNHTFSLTTWYVVDYNVIAQFPRVSVLLFVVHYLSLVQENIYFHTKTTPCYVHSHTPPHPYNHATMIELNTWTSWVNNYTFTANYPCLFTVSTQDAIELLCVPCPVNIVSVLIDWQSPLSLPFVIPPTRSRIHPH